MDRCGCLPAEVVESAAVQEANEARESHQISSMAQHRAHSSFVEGAESQNYFWQAKTGSTCNTGTTVK